MHFLPTKKLKATQTAAEPQRMRGALAAGVLSWLRLRDATQLLGSCSVLRHDARLVECALVQCASDGAHFFQRCPRDWFHMIQAPACWGGDGHLRCTSVHDAGRSYGEGSNAHPPASARTLSLVGELESCLAMYLGEAARSTALRVLLVPVSRSSSPRPHDSGSQSQSRFVTADWPYEVDSSEQQLVDKPPMSTFGAHWESITLEGRATTASCALCTACVDAVCRYRTETEAFAKRFEELLARQEEIWEKAGRSAADICELAFSFQQAYFEKEPLYSTYVANLNDSAILRYLCARGEFAVGDAESKTHEWKLDSHDPLSLQSRAACRALYQPLRGFLDQLRVTELRRYTIAPPTDSRDDDSRPALELLAGVTPEAIVGVYMMSA